MFVMSFLLLVLELSIVYCCKRVSEVCAFLLKVLIGVCMSCN